jgi:hypothetical protein
VYFLKVNFLCVYIYIRYFKNTKRRVKQLLQETGFIGFYLTDVEAKFYTRDLFRND